MTKTFNTIIQHKYDTLTNWESNNPTPLSGELCVVIVPPDSGAVVQEPAVLFKVGDGATAFNGLSYISAKAADVHNWAKAASKPTYTAEEISGLSDFIGEEIEDTNTEYKLEQDGANGHILKLFSKGVNDPDWNLVSTITTSDTVYDDTAISNRTTALEGLVGATAVATQIANAITALNLANTYEAKGAAALVESKLDAYIGSTDEAIDDIETALDNVYTKTETNTAISNAIGSAGHLKREVVTVLPTVGDANPDTIYMIKDASVGAGDAYKEYMLIEGAMVQIGDTSVNLEPYAKTVDVNSGIQGAKDYTDSEISALDIDSYAKTSSLSGIATSGNVNDLTQTSGDTIILFCGNSSSVI